ncbi:MAG TPA: FAD-binding domain-containing protein [Anaerolineales bacterium]|nr:FAD-binding domain-containing protein [Anaerolineales bacterium]
MTSLGWTGRDLRLTDKPALHGAEHSRILNPVLQALQFDPNGETIRKWIPEFRDLDSRVIHAPWEKGIEAEGCAARPIIGRNMVCTLKAYQASKETTKTAEFNE